MNTEIQNLLLKRTNLSFITIIYKILIQKLFHNKKKRESTELYLLYYYCEEGVKNFSVDLEIV